MACMNIETLQNIGIEKTVALGFVQLHLLKNGIVASEYTEDTHLTMEKVKAINTVMHELTGGKATGQLFIACPGLTVEKEVREFGATAQANRYTLYSAIVCNSLAHRILGNFFIKVQQPKVPTRMFSNCNDAILWLVSRLN